MKAHELAQALSALARLLKAGPNVELSQLRLTDTLSSGANQALALNLSTLVSLSNVDKRKWMELIEEHGFPIEVRKRDAARDVFGKLCSYLESNPRAQAQLKASATRTSGKSSPELMKALATLLRDDRHESPDVKGEDNEPTIK